MEKCSHFVISQISNLKDFNKGKQERLEESDLTLLSGDLVYQFKYIEQEDTRITVEPGTYALTIQDHVVKPEVIKLNDRFLLDSLTNAKVIKDEAKAFFSGLHIYEKRKKVKKRGILLYSDPGLGKTASIEKACKDFVDEDPGTVVVVWPTSEINPYDVNDFLTKSYKFSDKCTRLILIAEDIGGREKPGDHGQTPVDADLLNLLDGVGKVFEIPTLIIATTNFPQNLLESLADRPGRFDLVTEFLPPSDEEKINLLAFFLDREPTEEEKDQVTGKNMSWLSISYIEEAVIRAEIHNKSIKETMLELKRYHDKFKNAFSKKGNIDLCDR